MVATTPPQRTFVPQTLDLSDWSQIEPLYQSLLDRAIQSPAELEAWLLDLSELSAVIDEYGARRYVDKSCHCDDKQIEAAYLHFVEQIEPKVKPPFFAAQKKLIESPHRSGLKGKRYDVLIRQWQADVEIFREQNIPIETEVTKLVNEYDKIGSAMTVEFRGKEYTLQQMVKFLEEPDRATREESWRLATQRRLRDREAIETLFDQLFKFRQQIARNAGMPSFREFIWKSTKRFDYTPQDVRLFCDSIARTVVPLVDELDRRRAQDLKLPALRPWDQAVDPLNRPPLKPFAPDDIESFVTKTHSIFERLSPQLAEDFALMRRRGNLDLGSRKGKQPGGYQCSLQEVREPFIFMNAAGLNGDLRVLLHEGGHAFHLLACRNEPLVFLRSAPMEFCEVASIAMEFFGTPHLDVFYNPADHARSLRQHFEFTIRFLPWMAIIHSFQDWMYSNPSHSRAARTEEWLRLLDRYHSKLDWTGIEDVKQASWHRQLHIFNFPFYYVEYGIAQLGALQLWMKSLDDPQQALANYRAGLALGGTRSLPELFSGAGIVFDFSERTIAPLIQAVSEELSRLPE